MSYSNTFRRRNSRDWNERRGHQNRSHYPEDRDIIERHYERGDDEFRDERSNYGNGRPNFPNSGRPVYGSGPDFRRGHGYNQGRNSASNVGGRAYGHNYGQYYQGSDMRERSNPRDYQGDYDPFYREERDEDRFGGYGDRYDDDLRWEFRHGGFQGEGNNEGFGRRGGHRNEGQWGDDDTYRGGHAQRHRGYGKYGSR